MNGSVRIVFFLLSFTNLYVRFKYFDYVLCS